MREPQEHGEPVRTRRAAWSWQTDEPTGIGSGWVSGLLGAICGVLGLGAVLCFHYPWLLTTPEVRALYPVPLVRGLLHLVLVSGFLLGILSLTLRRNKMLGAIAVTATMAAALLGGSQVPIAGELQSGPFLGLDWFLLVQLTTILTLRPAMVLFDWARVPAIQGAIASLPGVAQFVLLVAVTDCTQYWVHRAFHAVPMLWRFHAVHHSADHMDWLAGSRLHLVDIAVTRGLTYVPIYVLGFADGPLMAYLVLVSAQATFIHANVRFEFGWLRWVLATPQFHHWHHAAEPEAVDKNFAVHLPVLDVLFGTAYLPGRWPSAYGLLHGERAPRGYLRQFAWPFQRRRRVQ